MSTYENNPKLLLQVDAKFFLDVFTVIHHRLRKKQHNLVPTESARTPRSS